MNSRTALKPRPVHADDAPGAGSAPADPRFSDRPGVHVHHASDSTTSTDPRLLAAIARAHNQEQIGRVVDESIAKAAELRRQREAEDAQRRRERDRQERLAETERLEQQEAQRVAEQHRDAQEHQESQDRAQREQDRRALIERRTHEGPFDQVA